MQNVYDLSLEAWTNYMEEQNAPAWRAKQVMEWLYTRRVTSFDEMTNLPLGLRQSLAQTFLFDPLEVVTSQLSKDGTVKFLFHLPDKEAIETVIIKHDYGNSVCVTTQVGCRVGCTFCASSLGGLRRNLTSGEIVAQVVKAQRYLDKHSERVNSIVVMGSGEPFENYDATMAFMRLMTAPEGMRIGQRHITVSTSGVVPNIYKFTDEGLQFGLAISLHAPNDKLRSQLMPINRRFPLRDLIDACRYYTAKTRRRLTFEYAMLKDENDTDEHAEQLAQLLKGIDSLVNLIPMNHVAERKHVRSSKNRIFRFREILTARGVKCTIRREYGHDIDAACGQLRHKHSRS